MIAQRAQFYVRLAAAVLVVTALAGCGQSESAKSTDIRTNVETNSTRPTTDRELAFSDPSEDASETDAEGGSDAEVATTPTTAGSGLPAVTTVPGGTGGSLDGYTGVLGRLTPDQNMASPVVAAPVGADGIQPLTGLAGDAPNRPAAVVKIDNGTAAVPHVGLNQADIVIEEEVEGGVTRFAAIFHSTSSIVGPVRSGRTTDIALVGGLGSPLLLYSGANDLTETLLRRQTFIQNHAYNTSSGYWRDDSRQAPSNLFTDTAPHWAPAVGGPPPPQFEYRQAGDTVDGQSASTFSVNYPASKASWEWSGNHWTRSQRGQRHKLSTGDVVTAANVVVIEAERVGTGMFDSAGGPVPEFVFVGSGPATVFTDGQRVDGVWTKPTLTSVATLTTPSGAVIKLAPGRTWIQLIEQDSGFLQ